MLKTPKTTVSIVSWTTMWCHGLQTGEYAQPKQQLSHFHIWTVVLCAELPGLTVEPDTQRHWQNAESKVAQIYTVFLSNLVLFSCWQAMPAELKSVHSVHTVASLLALLMPSLCLPWHFTRLMEKVTHCSWQVKSQTTYLYILISNNEGCYLPTSDASVAKRWLCMSVVCLLLQ